MTPPEVVTADPPHDIHYLRHVTTLGERHAIFAHAPIYSKTGVKLVDSGTRIDQRLLDKLSLHRILPPIDESLTAENAVTAASVRAAVAEMLQGTPALDRLLAASQLQEVLALLDRIPLPAPIAFKLTVAREERPTLWRHSLQVALLAAILARMEAGSVEQQVDAAAAGLLHDIGLLHIDPAIIDADQPLNEEQRHHLYSHPILAHLILNGSSNFAPRIAQAVLEHHERRDGSGYPHGHTGERLGELGQLLAVAELGTSVLLKQDGLPTRRHLEIVLRINAEQLSERHASHLLTLLAGMTGAEAAPRPPDPLSGSLPALLKIGIAINHWRSLRDLQEDLQLMHFIDGRVERLAHALADVGVDLDYWTTFNLELEQDVQSLEEIVAVTREGQWQLHSIAQELRRKWSSRLSGGLLEWIAAIDTAEAPAA